MKRYDRDRKKKIRKMEKKMKERKGFERGITRNEMYQKKIK